MKKILTDAGAVSIFMHLGKRDMIEKSRQVLSYIIERYIF